MASAPVGERAENASVSASSLIVVFSTCAGACGVFLNRLKRLVDEFADSVYNPGRLLFGRRVCVSTESVLPEKNASIISDLAIGSDFSRDGEGTSVMFTGSEAPLNQLASFSAFPEGLVGSAISSGGVTPTSNSAASVGETLSGEIERPLCRMKGKKVDLVGEEDRVRVKRGGRSIVVLDLWCEAP